MHDLGVAVKQFTASIQAHRCVDIQPESYRGLCSSVCLLLINGA